MYNGKQVFQIRSDIVTSKTAKDKNRWIYEHTEDNGKMIVMKSMYDEFSSIYIPVTAFEATMEPYFAGEKEDEEDIL